MLQARSILRIYSYYHISQKSSSVGKQAAPSPARQHIENTRSLSQNLDYGPLEYDQRARSEEQITEGKLKAISRTESINSAVL